MRQRRKQDELYRIMLEDVSSHVDRERIARALEQEKRSVCFDMIQDTLRNAVLDSTVSCYNAWPYVFTGRIYEQAAHDWDVIDNLIYDCMRLCGVPDGLYSRVKSMSYIIRSAVKCKVLEPDPCLMVFRNCVFDTETWEREAFSPSRVAVTMVDYNYDPDDQPTRWLTFLNRVLPDRTMQDVLQEYLGAIFVRRSNVTITKMLILLGSGANGKSVVYQTVRGILGEDNVRQFPIGSLTDRGECQKNLASINGKRLNYAPEMTMRDFNSKDKDLKSVISGEPQEARFVAKNPFTAYDIPLLMANTNFIPAWNDPSAGFRRRFIVIPFNVEIPESERDPQLASRLRDDYSGIFNWILDGKRRLISNDYNFTNTEEMEEVLDECQSSSSSVLRYMIARKFRSTHPDKSLEGAEVQAQALFEDYNKWCMGERIPPAEIENRNKFGRTLKSAGYAWRKSDTGVLYRIYCNRESLPMPYIREKGDEGRLKEESKADTRPFTDNTGQKWIRTRRAMAKHLGISEIVLGKLLKDGKLKDATRKDSANSRIVCFNIEKTRKAVQDYYASKIRSQEEIAEADKRNAMRAHFNQRMKELHLPYRKYDNKWDIYFQANTDGLIRVPDDWVYENEVPVEEQSPLIRRRRINRDIIDYDEKQ